MVDKCSDCGVEIIYVDMDNKRHPVDVEGQMKLVVLNGNKSKGAIRTCGISHYETCSVLLAQKAK